MGPLPLYLRLLLPPKVALLQKGTRSNVTLVGGEMWDSSDSRSEQRTISGHNRPRTTVINGRHWLQGIESTPTTRCAETLPKAAPPTTPVR